MASFRPTSLLEITGLGASLSIFHAVASVWFIPARENHKPLVGEAELDVTVEVGTAPQSIS